MLNYALKKIQTLTHFHIMLVPFSWLKQHLELTPEQEASLSPEKIADVLTLAGLEVDKVEKTALGFSGVVVAKVLEASQHPEAEKLRVAKVTDGTSTYQIVCGAPNCRAGLVTALATIGAQLTQPSGDTFKIKKSKLRGIDSEGMLCASDELGLGGDQQGILELDAQLTLGTSLEDLYGDTIFEISLTPNLGHCLSIRGIARELCALMGLKLSFSKPVISAGSIITSDKISVTIDDASACYSYYCRYLENVKVEPSPSWLKERLESCGLRSINNIVDVTNYVMLSLGQPLHAFDYDTIEGQEIVVKSCEEPLQLRLLDETERTIPARALLICDSVKPLALAGIMGCHNSAITETTTRLLLEAAHFDPSAIRKTMKTMQLRTDSSSRFEKGIDHEGVEKALDLAVSLIQEINGATVSESTLCEIARPFQSKVLTCRLKKINHVLGTHLSLHEVEHIFHRLKMPCQIDASNEILTLTIPSYRNDIKEEIDLVEEVARVYGYHHIDLPTPYVINSTLPHSPLYLMEKNIRQRLVSEGLQEMLTCDLISPKMAQSCIENSMQERSLIHVMQPSSVDQSILRPSMLPGLLQAIRHNLDFQRPHIAAFELGLIHYKLDGKFIEKPTAAIILSGSARPHFWGDKETPFDIFDLKGMCENLFEGLDLESVAYTHHHFSKLHPGRQAAIVKDQVQLGFLGEVHPETLQAFDIKGKVYFAQIDLEELMKMCSGVTMMHPLPIYPGSERDWTGTFKESCSMEMIVSSLQSLSSRLLKNVALLDIYRSEKLGPDKKNITLRFSYRDDHKTLSQEAVDKEHARLLALGMQKMQHILISSI